jgi:phospholipid/cholesterol/gamma-HCH transport system permease protein
VHRVDFDESGLPGATRRLLGLFRMEPQGRTATRAHIGVVERFGEWALARWSDGAAFATLAGEAVLRAVPALRGKVRTRAGDLLNLIYATSAAALPIVALVNILVGAIVAFVGGIQLRRLGAEVYVSNLIGVTEVREMAPLITAIVMSEPTGCAYAAEISAMQGRDEIDALRALGIPIFDYLVLPRPVALAAMMAPLCAYAGWPWASWGSPASISGTPWQARTSPSDWAPGIVMSTLRLGAQGARSSLLRRLHLRIGIDVDTRCFDRPFNRSACRCLAVRH